MLRYSSVWRQSTKYIESVLYHPDVIMDMFQAPTLLEDPFSNTSVLHTAKREAEPGYPRNGKNAGNRLDISEGLIQSREDESTARNHCCIMCRAPD